MAVDATFFSLTDGSYQFQKHFITMHLQNWDKFDPQNFFKKTCLILFCDTEWPQYPLEDGGHWPVEGLFNYDTVLQLDQLCRKQEKWVEVTYMLLFISL